MLPSGLPISGRPGSPVRAPALLAACVLAIASGCRTGRPSEWSPDHAVLARADFDASNHVTVHNIRNCVYRTSTDYTPQYYDRTYDLAQLDSVDFVLVPFNRFSAGAHTFLSFGFEGRDYLAVSAELRKRRRDVFPSLRSGLPLRPLIYVVGNERDLIGLRTNYRHNDVYVYRLRATPQQVQAMFRDCMVRANKLIDQPEYYNVVTNNCNTNVLRHINHIAAHRIPYSWQVLLPGYSDRVLYEMGLLDTRASFDETRRQAKVSETATRFLNSPDFSSQIRWARTTAQPLAR